jgi:hypothetical protein
MTSPDTEFINILGTSPGASDTTVTRTAGKSIPSTLPDPRAVGRGPLPRHGFSVAGRIHRKHPVDR